MNIQPNRSHHNTSNASRVNTTGELRANDTDGFALEAQPGKSQGRPLTSTGSKPIAQIGLPNMRSPKAPEPSRPSLNPHRPDQQPQNDILMPRRAAARRERGSVNQNRLV
jgi:hypothetical protein